MTPSAELGAEPQGRAKIGEHPHISFAKVVWYPAKHHENTQFNIIITQSVIQ